MPTILRRLRGAVGNALVWGLAWFGIGLVVHTITAVLSGGRFFWPYEFLNAAYVARYMGISGALVGAGFSLFIATNFRHQRLEDLRPWRFTFGAGLVTALMSLVLLLVSGSWIWPFDLPILIGAMATYALVGSTTAYGTIRLAQRRDPNVVELPEAQGEANSPGSTLKCNTA